jgi:hypothetical protein
LSSPEQTPPGSTTPDPTTATPERSAPGDTLAVDDISRLGSTYATRLRNASYRLRSTQRFRVNGTVGASTLTRRVVAGGRTYVERFERTAEAGEGTNVSYTYFYNGSVTATRYTSGTTSSYGVNTNPRPPGDISGRGQLEDLLRAFAIERRSDAPLRNGVAFVGTRIRNPFALATPVAAADPRNGTLALRLYRNGTTTLRATYTVAVDDTDAGEITRTFRVDRLGNVSVSAPPWLATAQAREDARNSTG